MLLSRIKARRQSLARINAILATKKHRVLTPRQVEQEHDTGWIAILHDINSTVHDMAYRDSGHFRGTIDLNAIYQGTHRRDSHDNTIVQMPTVSENL